MQVSDLGQFFGLRILRAVESRHRRLIVDDLAGQHLALHFEHASLLADLDGDGRDELYVASDRHKEVRRYVWDGANLVREVIYIRPDPRSIFTWNLAVVPVGLMPIDAP